MSTYVIKYACTEVTPYGIESVPKFLPTEFWSSDNTALPNSYIDSFGNSGIVLNLTKTNINNGIYIYRIGKTLTDYTLVVKLPPNGTLVDEFIDTKSDDEIVGIHLLETVTSGTPPKGLKGIKVIYATMFGYINDKLYFSNIGEFNRWSSSHYLDFDEDITGFGSVHNGIIVFTKYSSWLVTGESFEQFSKYQLSKEIGCTNDRTVVNYDTTLLWQSHIGIMSYNGSSLENITKILLPIGYLKDSISAIVSNNYYILGFIDKLVILDFRYDFCIREVDIGGTLSSTDNKAYLRKEDGSIVCLFDGIDSRELTYRSVLLKDGKLTEYKTYKDFYISYIGDITITILSEGEIIYNGTLPTTIKRNTINIKTINHFKGYAIEMVIVGTGEVYEVDYQIVGRGNGK